MDTTQRNAPHLFQTKTTKNMIKEVTQKEFDDLLEVYGVSPEDSRQVEGSLPHGAYAIIWTYQGKKGQGYVMQRKGITSDRYLQSYYLIENDRYLIQDRENGEILASSNNKNELAKTLKQMRYKGFHGDLIAMF